MFRSEEKDRRAAGMSDKRKTEEFQPGRGYGKANWDAVSDSPEATDEDQAQAKPCAEVFPELVEKMCRKRA